MSYKQEPGRAGSADAVQDVPDSHDDVADPVFATAGTVIGQMQGHTTDHEEYGSGRAALVGTAAIRDARPIGRSSRKPDETRGAPERSSR